MNLSKMDLFGKMTSAKLPVNRFQDPLSALFLIIIIVIVKLSL